jgi:hypothetical protein
MGNEGLILVPEILRKIDIVPELFSRVTQQDFPRILKENQEFYEFFQFA